MARVHAPLRNAADFVNDGHCVVVGSNNKGERPSLPYVVKWVRMHRRKNLNETLYDFGYRRTS
jgi:hypothetical protein